MCITIFFLGLIYMAVFFGGLRALEAIIDHLFIWRPTVGEEVKAVCVFAYIIAFVIFTTVMES